MKNHTPKKGTITSSQALTDSYVTVGDAEAVQAGAGRDQIALLIDYDKGNETSCELKIQFSDTFEFTDVYEDSYTTTQGGESTIEARNYKLEATGKHRILIPSAGLYWRVQAKATGGTPDGTLGLKYRMDVIDK